jgi:hypothetical protein
MATDERSTGTRDEQYNVISVLYHALQGADTCATYLQDAERAGDQDLVQFFREAQGMYRQLVNQGKPLLWQRLRPPPTTDDPTRDEDGGDSGRER